MKGDQVVNIDSKYFKYLGESTWIYDNSWYNTEVTLTKSIVGPASLI